VAKDAVSVKVDDHGIRELVSALRKEEDGKQLRKDLTKELRDAVAPGVTAVKGKLRSMPHRSATKSSPALGTYVASRVKSQIKLSGKSSGIFIRIPMTPQVRGFKLAARRLNRKHWRHRVYGRNAWVTQISPIPGYLDDTLAKDKPKYRAAVVAALDDMRKRLARRTYK
jgi:hypothetical protein